jgi:hypothetical protein
LQKRLVASAFGILRLTRAWWRLRREIRFRSGKFEGMTHNLVSQRTIIVDRNDILGLARDLAFDINLPVPVNGLIEKLQDL